jgi:multidrug efflux system outer membrane protein
VRAAHGLRARAEASRRRGADGARARQQSDEVIVARERQRKALQDIIKQVRVAYWRAVRAERLIGRVRMIAESMKAAIRESRNLEATGANDIAKSVSYRREIIESVRQALDVQRELREAKAGLAELLNIQPGSDFELASVHLASAMPTMPLTLEEMEVHALDYRPELRIEDYNERMSAW